ncbi:MAG: lysylphosphatidylglycerol synthase transmembrane domain-containing protein [Planctomycetota bacterium]
MKNEPSPDASRPERQAMIVDLRRAVAETARERSIVVRVAGFLVLALAVWVISRNVSWNDTLRIETADGAVEIEGQILGDWRDAEVGFSVPEARVAAESFAVPGLPAAAAAALEDAVTPYAELTLTEDELRAADGSVVAATDGTSILRIEARPGMLRAVSEMRIGRLLPAFGFLVIASLFVATRWWRLLALNGCPTRWYDALRYTYAGLFFNTIVPGFNGGDVARAFAVVRNHPNRRADALMTVVVDRAVGLVAMILIGTGFVLTADERLDAVKVPVAVFCAAVLIGGGLFFSGRVRRVVRFDGIVGRLPQGERLLRLDAAAQRLMRRPLEMVIALTFSIANHVFNGLAVMFAASALGSELGFADWMATMAIANTLSSVPISPGGLGVGEVLYGSLARSLGSTYAIGVATSLVYRLCLYALSLLGGVVMLLPSSRSEATAAPAGADPG